METHDKEVYYFTHTLEHIHRVQKNMLCLVTKHKGEMKLTSETCRKLMHNVMKHDRSKFSVPQFLPYIELREFYRQKKVLRNTPYKYPEGVEGKVRDAVNDHYTQENHHPEMFQKDEERKWDFYNAIECACDIQAKAQEYGEGSCRKFWKEVWQEKYKNWFYNEFNWEEIKTWMDQAITCFENDIADSEVKNTLNFLENYGTKGTAKDHMNEGSC